MCRVSNLMFRISCVILWNLNFRCLISYFIMMSSDYMFQISYFECHCSCLTFRVSDFIFRISCFVCHISYSGLHVLYVITRFWDSICRISDSRFQTSDFSSWGSWGNLARELAETSGLTSGTSPLSYCIRTL